MHLSLLQGPFGSLQGCQQWLGVRFLCILGPLLTGIKISQAATSCIGAGAPEPEQ
jgi:hypothetical protein